MELQRHLKIYLHYFVSIIKISIDSVNVPILQWRVKLYGIFNGVARECVHTAPDIFFRYSRASRKTSAKRAYVMAGK